ncbi:MAG TPA: glycosyltransferase family A protein [Pyrinomonadaceae bacterium]|nr:glycosyltransferase family 2 protein [Acidobacteriota bacterium]HQZ97073.1 glycosyltransferase family A protein [Pyrinomonadaceae bacterium]
MPESTQKPRQIRKRVGRNVFDAPPRVSVIITAYNKARYIKETVDSVLAQKYREHEIIVVNDGSDDTDYLERELKMRMEDIIYIRQRHAGEGAARNTGIENARGSIIAFLNAGDLWQPDLLASQNVYLERNGLDLVYCDAAIFGTNSAYRRNFMDRFPSAGEVNSLSLLERRCNVLMSGTVVRKSHIAAAGMFAYENANRPALHLWLRMAKAGARIGYQNKQLVKLRTERDGAEPDALSRLECERNVFENIRRTIELNEEETKIVRRRIAELEAEIAVEQGHSFLRSGDYTEAVMAFRVANRHQHSLKLTAMTWLARVAPKTAMRFSAANHPAGSVYTTPRI